jgi:hypothetical protein
MTAIRDGPSGASVLSLRRRDQSLPILPRIASSAQRTLWGQSLLLFLVTNPSEYHRDQRYAALTINMIPGDADLSLNPATSRALFSI